MAPWNLWITVLSISLFGMNGLFEQMLFSYIPGPLGEMYNQSFQKHYGTQLDSMGISTVMSAMAFFELAGILSSIFFVLPLIDSRGRKFVAIYVRCLISSLVAVLQILSFLLPSVECFALSMFFAGMAMQVKMTATSLFIGECTGSRQRATFMMMLVIGEGAGGLIMNNLCRPSFLGNSSNWVWIPSIALLLSILLFISNLRIPESPVWLVSKGKDGRKAIEFYRGKADIEEELFQLKLETKLKSVDHMTYKQVWKDDATREALFVVLLVCCTYLVLSPTTIEFMYLVLLMEKLGIDAESTMTYQTILAFLSVPAFITGIYLIDRIGRRQVYFIGAGLLFLKGSVTCAGLMVSSLLSPSLFTQIAGVLSILLGGMVGSSGLFVLDSVLICELLPPAARVTVAQLTILVPMLLSIPLGTVFPVAFNLFPPSLYFAYLLFQPLCVIYVYRNLVETKNKPLYEVVEEIEEVVRSRATTRLSLSNARTSLISSMDIKKYRSINQYD